MTTISILITTYGNRSWERMAATRAWPSAAFQGAHEILTNHYDELRIGPARNENAKAATGDWLCFLDADDELEPSFTEHMTRMMASTAARGDGTRPGSCLLTPAVSYVRGGRAGPARFNKGTDLRNDNWMVVGTLIPRWLFNEVGGFNDYEHGFEDWSLWAKAWKAGAQIVQVPRAVYIAHINPQSDHRQRWRKRQWQAEEHVRVRRELFPEEYEEAKR